MNLKKNLHFIPLALSLILAILSAYKTVLNQSGIFHSSTSISTFIEILEIESSHLSLWQISTIVGLILVLILALLKRKIWAHVFAVLVLLSTFHLGQVYVFTYSFGISFLKIELISFVLLILHLYLNPEVVGRLEKALHLNKKEGSKKEINEQMVAHFEHKYSEHSEQDLSSILKDDKHVQEVKIAIARIIEKRTKKMSNETLNK